MSFVMQHAGKVAGVGGVGFCRLVRSMSRKDLTPQTPKLRRCAQAGSDPSNFPLVFHTSRESAKSAPEPGKVSAQGAVPRSGSVPNLRCKVRA